jgi:hypothetical protein
MDESLSRPFIGTTLRKWAIGYPFLWWTTLRQRNVLAARRPRLVNLRRGEATDSNRPF